MTPLFVDTSAWYPLADAGHPDHERVAEALRNRVLDGAEIVTTNRGCRVRDGAGAGLGAPPPAPSGPWNRPVLGSGKPAKAIHELAVRSSRNLIY